MFRSVFPTVAILAAFASATNIQISNGTIQGGQCASTKSNFFLSIPFADPPVGKLRYQAPQAFSRLYNGTLNATKQAPSCYQFGEGALLSAPQSEDCLYLDVYAPANATSTSALPVKVWLYGGAFEIGGISDPMYNGCNLAEDAVVVSINYRLGPLGYLTLQNTTISGNYGVLDQLQGLRWVQDNIAAFGGDPKQVLLFGQSAGAISSFALATLPEIRSLANAVVMESGGGVDLATISSAQTFNEQYVNALNCSATDVDCIRSIQPAQLQSTFNNWPQTGLGFVFTLHDWSGAEFPWGPKVGTPLFPVQPSQVGVKIPAIFGSNGFEGSVFVLSKFGVDGISNLTNKDYMDFLNVNFGSLTSEIAQQYPLSSFNNSVFEAMSIVNRDSLFRCTAHRGASLAAAKGIPVWTYSFNQTLTCPFSPAVPQKILPLLGACHSSEIPFTWGEASGLPRPNGTCTFTEGERNISSYMQNSWTSMATNAKPGDWPAFSPNSTLGINFQKGSIVPGTVDYSMCAFWDKIAADLVNDPSTNGTSGAGNGSGVSVSSAPDAHGASTFSTSLLWAFATTVLVYAPLW